MDSGDRSHEITVLLNPTWTHGVTLPSHQCGRWMVRSFFLVRGRKLTTRPMQSLHCHPMGWVGWTDSQGKASSDVIPLSLRRYAAVIQPQSSPGRSFFLPL